MTNSEQSRRHVLKALAGAGAAGVTTALAGCSTVENALGGSGGDVSTVPEDAESVVTVDVAAVIDDEAVQRVTDAYLELRAQAEWYEGPEDYEALLEEFEDETGLDATQATALTGFSEYSEYGLYSGYGGTIFTGQWDESEVVDAYEDGGTADEREYEGATVYEDPEYDQQPVLGVLGDGRYVMGYRDVVEDVIDVTAGEKDGLDSDLQSTYSSTRSAPIRYAGEMPSWVESGDVRQGGTTLDTSVLEGVDFVSGSVSKSDGNVSTETTMHAQDEETAEDVTDLVNGALVIVENGEGTDERVREEIDEIEVERDGDTVVLTYAKAVEEIEALIEAAGEESQT